jgi:hypothetical protein
MEPDSPRSRAARTAAERALVRVVHHYGSRPEFVVLGGLVPELLCGRSGLRHAGTSDVDVQVNLEIAAGATNTARLEQALRNAEFHPDNERVWRWVDTGAAAGTMNTTVKFELLADLDSAPAGSTIVFDDCDRLGAANLRGTGFASRDVVPHTLRARMGGMTHEAEVNVTGVAGFLLAKAAAAHARRKAKDWYDIAFVLLHNDLGGPDAAAEAVRMRFERDLVGSIHTVLVDLKANFAEPSAQGPQAYVDQMMADHPELDAATLAADAVLAVEAFQRALMSTSRAFRS